MSTDAVQYASQESFTLNLWQKDILVNHMLPDDETAAGFTYTLAPRISTKARYIQFKITPKRTLTVSEVQVFDSIRYEPCDLRIALPSK